MLHPKTHFDLSYSNDPNKNKWKLGTRLSLKFRIPKHVSTLVVILRPSVSFTSAQWSFSLPLFSAPWSWESAVKAGFHSSRRLSKVRALEDGGRIQLSPGFTLSRGHIATGSGCSSEKPQTGQSRSVSPSRLVCLSTLHGVSRPEFQRCFGPSLSLPGVCRGVSTPWGWAPCGNSQVANSSVLESHCELSVFPEREPSVSVFARL